MLATSYFKTTCTTCNTTYESSTARSKCTKCSSTNESVRYITPDVERDAEVDIKDQVESMWRGCSYNILGMKHFGAYYSAFLYKLKLFLYDSKKAVIPNKKVTTADKAKYFHEAIKYLSKQSAEFILQLANPERFSTSNYPIADDIVLEKHDPSWYETELKGSTIFEIKPFLVKSIGFHKNVHKFLIDYREKTEAEIEKDFDNIKAKIIKLAKSY